MLIRSATVDDVPAVLPLVRALCDLHQAADPERFRVVPDVIERYARWLTERAVDARSVFLVAEHPLVKGLAGYAACTIEPEVPIFWVPECGWVHDVFVVPSARRHGVARGLVREVCARFTGLGVKQVRLHTAAFNDAARAAFAREGFRACVVEMLRGL